MVINFLCEIFYRISNGSQKDIQNKDFDSIYDKQAQLAGDGTYPWGKILGLKFN